MLEDGRLSRIAFIPSAVISCSIDEKWQRSPTATHLNSHGSSISCEAYNLEDTQQWLSLLFVQYWYLFAINTQLIPNFEYLSSPKCERRILGDYSKVLALLVDQIDGLMESQDAEDGKAEKNGTMQGECVNVSIG